MRGDVRFSNDFLLRDGTFLPQGSTQEELFNFGSDYQTTPFDSLFLYPGAESWATYNDNTFVPEFTSSNLASEALRQQAMKVCANSFEPDACIFDVAQSGDLQAALVTLNDNQEQFALDQETNSPPSFVSSFLGGCDARGNCCGRL